MPADATGRWLSRSQLVEQASRLAHALAPAPAPLFVTLRDARMLSVRRSNAAVRRAAAERAAAAAAAPAAEAGAEKAKVVGQTWAAKWGNAGRGTVTEDGGVKLSKPSSGAAVDDASAAVSATPLPSSGIGYVELVYKRTHTRDGRMAEGSSLGGNYFTGVVSAEAAARPAMYKAEPADAASLRVTPNGFWGFEDGDDVDDCRICRGKGDEGESATAAMLTRRIKGVGQKRMFVNGDRVGLLVDMEAHTMRVFINDTLVPDLVFDSLPSPLSVAATPYNDDVTLTIKCISPDDWPTAVVTAAEAPVMTSREESRLAALREYLVSLGKDDALDGWRATEKERPSGASAGTSDFFYTSPPFAGYPTGKRFRSFKEVAKFLELDTTAKPKAAAPKAPKAGAPAMTTTAARRAWTATARRPAVRRRPAAAAEAVRASRWARRRCRRRRRRRRPPPPPPATASASASAARPAYSARSPHPTNQSPARPPLAPSARPPSASRWCRARDTWPPP